VKFLERLGDACARHDGPSVGDRRVSDDLSGDTCRPTYLGRGAGARLSGTAFGPTADVR
jgi:hypothetical protein